MSERKMREGGYAACDDAVGAVAKLMAQQHVDATHGAEGYSWDAADAVWRNGWLRKARELLSAADAAVAPGGEAAQAAETCKGSTEGEHSVGKAEAPINSTMLSALKAMDEAMTWHCPSGPEAAKRKEILSHRQCEAWIQIRSAISQADGR